MTNTYPLNGPIKCGRLIARFALINTLRNQKITPRTQEKYKNKNGLDISMGLYDEWAHLLSSKVCSLM